MSDLSDKLLNVTGGATAVLFLALVVSLGVRAGPAMPSYALVYIDDDTKTYIAPSCIEEWQSRPSETFAIVRAATAGEAHDLGYNPDATCRDTGAFTGIDQSLFRSFLESANIVEPIEQWWDAPYQKEDGTIVYPGQ